MATTYRQLGAQASTGVIGTADTSIVYTNATATSTVISTISVCNTSSSAATFSIAISNTTSFSAGKYVVYQATVAGNDTVFLTAGLTMDATYGIYLLTSASTTSVNFSVYGSVIS
jgi:hypothetical protein